MARIINPAHHEGAVQAGEQRLLDFLEAQLPDTFLLVPNVNLAYRNPRNNAVDLLEYDLIVVAPHALYHLENKDWRGHLIGDDHTWRVSGRSFKSPLLGARFKTSVLASRLKQENAAWGRAWIETSITLSDPSMVSRQLPDATGSRVFSLDQSLTTYLQDHDAARSTPGKIADLQEGVVAFLTGLSQEPRPEPKLFEADYEVLDILAQSADCTEYLVRPRGLDGAGQKRVRAYSLDVHELSPADRAFRLGVIRNQYQALQKIGAAPHVLTVQMLTDELRGELFEITDYLDEKTLAMELDRATYSLPEKLALIRQVALALQAAHAAGVYHRDVRPANIYLTAAGAFLGNFSRAFFRAAQREGITVLPAAADDDADALPYRATELDDSPADATAATDVYGLGLTLYETLTGERALPNSWHDLDHWQGKLPASELPGRRVPGLPEWVDNLVDQMVRLQPADRLQTMTEVLAKLDQGLSNTRTLTTPAPASTPAPTASDGRIRVGDQQESYLFVSPLGEGGYSEVWKVKHTLQGEERAIKVYNESVNTRTVLDEYNALKGLDHRNIVKFVWNGELPTGRFFTLMELLEGDCLGDYVGGVKGEQRLPLPIIFQLGQELTGALRYLHERPHPIFHRDIKPRNIIWHRNERFVLIDFNVATSEAADKDHVGTSFYIAPDRVVDQMRVRWDESCDTFALGITLFELVCKRHPWADANGKANKPIITREPHHPKTLRPELSDGFAAWLLKAVQPQRADRFATAREMQDALEQLGLPGLLADRLVPATTIPTEKFVMELNKLFSQSRYTNAGTRGLDAFAERTYIKTRLDTKLINDILQAKYRLVIITGNAGDGKTAFIQKLEKEAQKLFSASFKRDSVTQNGASFESQGIPFQSNYDGSQDEGDKENTQVLDEFLAPFAGRADFDKVPAGRLIAINEGRLVEYLQAHRAEFGALEKAVEAFFYEEGVTDLPAGLLLVNLNLRSVVSLSELTGEQSIFRRQIKELVKPEFWTGCNTCAVREQCFIRYNAQSLNDPDAGDEVLRRMERLLLTVHLRRELHLTMRDLRSLLAFWLTRDHSCADVKALAAAGQAMPLLEKYYFNLPDSEAEDAGNRDRLVKLVRLTDVGQRALPELDRNLYYNPLQGRNYLPFSAQREGDLLSWLEREKVALRDAPTEEGQLPPQRPLHRLLARHQYFEGRFDSDLRLPYRAVGQFAKVLMATPVEQQRELDKLRLNIAYAIAILERCPNKLISEQYLVLAVGEKDNVAMTYRLFALADFELRLGVPPKRTEYLEYFPDRLVFRHLTLPHVSMEISLDLFELLTYIGLGYQPSLNDLKGRFLELQLFKNLLANLPYRQVLVTGDHRDYYTVEADPQNKIVVQKKQFAAPVLLAQPA
ncbi:protein kinase [Hymenobacter fastidiosus]|uniref:Protein kinase n=1 Tax=Hymenobacter fastidiosus TaxID=486264 RepID=A0ABP7SPK6_9BACT